LLELKRLLDNVEEEAHVEALFRRALQQQAASVLALLYQ